jgi:hypothetical protein
MLETQLVKFFHPESGVGTAETSVKVPTPKTADDINDLFKEIDSDEKVEKIEKKESKTSKKDKEVESDERETSEETDEIELTEPDEEIEKLDLKEDDDITFDAPPRKKEILKEYPELFKKFPFLEKMLYRDRQYSELFGSFDDAKEIAEKSESFNNFESQLLAGNTEEILREVKTADEKAFNIIVDDYLPTLAKVDKEAYFHVVGNLNRRLIMEMVQEANDTSNDDLKQAALLVNQFVFGSSKFIAPTLRVDKTDKSAERSEAEQERLSFTRERFESARDDLQSRVDNTLRATISDYIDPKGAMSSYVKKNAVADAMKILSSSIALESSTVKNLDKLWRSAFDSKFSKDSLNKIQSFYLSKAKGNLKNAIMKARAEALKDSKPHVQREKETDDREEQEEETPRTLRKNITPGRPSQPKNKDGIKRGESVADFFMRD